MLWQLVPGTPFRRQLRDRRKGIALILRLGYQHIIVRRRPEIGLVELRVIVLGTPFSNSSGLFRYITECNRRRIDIVRRCKTILDFGTLELGVTQLLCALLDRRCYTGRLESAPR